MKAPISDLYDPKFGQSAPHVMPTNFKHAPGPHTFQTGPGALKVDDMPSYVTNSGSTITNGFTNGFIESPSTSAAQSGRHGNLSAAYRSDPGRNQAFTSYPGGVIPPPAHSRFPHPSYGPWEGGQAVCNCQQFGPGYGVQSECFIT